MRTYSIGRSPEADIVLEHRSVSRNHAEVIFGKDGRWYWIDRNSSNGSFRRVDAQWVPLSKDYVAADEPIRLGEVETTLADLLRLAGLGGGQERRQAASRSDPGRGRGQVERDSFGMVRPKR